MLQWHRAVLLLLLLLLQALLCRHCQARRQRAKGVACDAQDVACCLWHHKSGLCAVQAHCRVERRRPLPPEVLRPLQLALQRHRCNSAVRAGGRCECCRRGCGFDLVFNGRFA
jgi:hypothetical protein